MSSKKVVEVIMFALCSGNKLSKWEKGEGRKHGTNREMPLLLRVEFLVTTKRWIIVAESPHDDMRLGMEKTSVPFINSTSIEKMGERERKSRLFYHYWEGGYYMEKINQGCCSFYS